MRIKVQPVTALGGDEVRRRVFGRNWKGYVDREHPCRELMCMIVFGQDAAVEQSGSLVSRSRKWKYPMRSSESVVLGALH